MCRRPTKERATIYNGTSESLVRIELLTLFHRNPGLVCTSADLAEAIGRDPEVVEEQAHKLMHLRILDVVEGEGEKRYRYQPPRSVADPLDETDREVTAAG